MRGGLPVIAIRAGEKKMTKACWMGRALLVAALGLVQAGCGQKQGAEPPGAAPMPLQPSTAQAPPVEAPFMQGGATGPSEEGQALPLKLAGMNSLEEMRRALAKLPDQPSRDLFERAYRLTFTSDASGRNYAEAESGFRQVLQKNPKSAESYRGLGYALFNEGQGDSALENYLKAIEIDPDYGEAHYAVAFLYAIGDTSKGRQHFQKAMQLGIPDERKLGERFYK